MSPRAKRPWVSVARLSNVMGKFIREDWKPGTERVPLFPDEHQMPQLTTRALELNYELLLPIFTAFPHAAPTLSCIRDSWVEATTPIEDATAFDVNEEAIRIHDLWSYTWELARRTKTKLSRSVRAARLKAAMWGICSNSCQWPRTPLASDGDGDSSSRFSAAVSASGSVNPSFPEDTESEHEEWPCYPGVEAEDAGAVDEGKDSGEVVPEKLAHGLGRAESKWAVAEAQAKKAA